MLTKPKNNLIYSRFTLAAALQQAAHHFDLKVTTSDSEKELNKMLVDILVKEVDKITELGLVELSKEKSDG